MTNRSRHRSYLLAVAAAALALSAGACSSDDSTSASATTTTTAASEDFCEVAAEWVETLPRNASGGAQGPASPAPEDVEDYFRTDTEYLGRLDELSGQATPAVADALSRLHPASVGLLEDLEASNFDFSVAAANASDPTLLADRATLESYIETACGVTA